MAVDYNSVPLGRAGTGGAFVLGGSQAAETLANTLDYNQKIAQQNALLKQQQAQQLANSWKQNQLKVDGGLYWQPEFNKRYQQHMEKGIQLRQMGVDPFNYNANDPTQSKIAEDYLMERQGMLSDTANRKATESAVKPLFDKVSTDPSKYYSSDIEKLNNYINTPYSEAMNMPLPTLTERFDPNALLAKITPSEVGSEIVVGNKRIKSVKALPEETRSAIVGAYKNDLGTARWVDELTGRQGFTIPILESIPDTKEAVRTQLEAQYKGNPDVRTQLAQQGITPNSERYKSFIETETNRLYNAKKTWNDQLQSDLQQVLPKVREMESVLPDYSAEDQAMSRERLALSREANSRARTSFNERNNPQQDEQVTFRQQWVDDMWNQEAGSGERLKSIVSGQNGYDGDLAIRIQGNKINYIIPRKVETSVTVKDGKTSTTSKVVPGRTVTIDRSNANDKNKLNELINDLTGETINPTKFNTEGGKGKTVRTENKEVPASRIKGLVGKKGYEGYTEKELIDFYRSQGYTIK